VTFCANSLTIGERAVNWQLVTIDLASDDEEISSSLLFDLGTTGIITLEESEGRVKLGAYFDGQVDGEEIVRKIEAKFLSAGLIDASSRVSISEVPDQDWMQKWKEGFEPVEIGARLVVAPSWKLPENREGRAVVQIDPGMAFGTGTHETTRLCLEAIERYWQGGRLLDVGTGTGILAIAATMLNQSSAVTAIDIDPQAVGVARENAEINRVAERVEIIEGEIRQFTSRAFDLVVANLTAEVIISLVADLASCLASNGLMILSGILTTLASDVERALDEAGLVAIEHQKAGEWSMIVARRREA